MTLISLQLAEEVKNPYLRYQLTSARLTDSVLGEQFEDQLWRSDSRLFKGPFVSICRAYEESRSVATLVANETLPSACDESSLTMATSEKTRMEMGVKSIEVEAR